MNKAQRTIANAIRPLLANANEYDAEVLDDAERHITLASGKLEKPKIGSGDFTIDGKPFLFDQIVSVSIREKIVFHFGFIS